MATEASISLVNKNGTVITVYCHSNGYIEDVGEILRKYYNSYVKVQRLLENGDIYILCKRRNPRKNRQHNIEIPQKDVTLFYHRDCNVKYDTVKPIVGYDSIIYTYWSVYNYLFKDGIWYFAYRSLKDSKQNILDIFEPLENFI